MADGLFGNAADVGRMAVIQDRLRRAQILGSLGPGGHGALAGAHLGGALTGLFGGQNPMLTQQMRLQQIGQDMEAQGLEPGSPGFSQQVFRRMLAAGFTQQDALAAFLQAQEAERGAADIAKARGGIANPQAIQMRFRALLAAGIPESSAMVLAQDSKQTADALRDQRAARQESQKARSLRDLLQNPDLMALEMRLRRAGATSITLGDKPAAKADRDLVTLPDGSPVPVDTTPSDIVAGVEAGTLIQKTPAQAKADELRLKKEVEKDISREQAAPILRQYINALRAGNRSFVLANQNKAGVAYARLRNPTGIVTDQDVNQAIRDLPGLASREATRIGINLLEDSIKGIEAETGIALGGGASIEKEPAKFREGQTATNPQTRQRIIFRNGRWQNL